MSRQEDFDRQADDYSNCCFEEDDSLFAAFHFKEGAEHGYQYAVDKAVEFLKTKEFGDWIEQEASSFIEDFRKAMQ